MGFGANVLSRTCRRKEARKKKKKLERMQKVAHATHKKVTSCCLIVQWIIASKQSGCEWRGELFFTSFFFSS